MDSLVMRLCAILAFISFCSAVLREFKAVVFEISELTSSFIILFYSARHKSLS